MTEIRLISIVTGVLVFGLVLSCCNIDYRASPVLVLVCDPGHTILLILVLGQVATSVGQSASLTAFASCSITDALCKPGDGQ